MEIYIEICAFAIIKIISFLFVWKQFLPDDKLIFEFVFVSVETEICLYLESDSHLVNVSLLQNNL